MPLWQRYVWHPPDYGYCRLRSIYAFEPLFEECELQRLAQSQAPLEYYLL